MDTINKIGRRKTSVARIYLKPGNGKIEVNGKDYKVYFPSIVLQKEVTEPLSVTQKLESYDITVNVQGGGVTGQAGAVSMAIARAIDQLDPENYHSILRQEGLLTRDARMVERKKFGRRKARKRFQFSKR